MKRVPPLLLCAFALGAWAQMSTSSGTTDMSQQPFVFERYDNLVRFETDGSGVRETTAAVRIQSQAAMQAFGQLILGYSSANETLKVVYARVRKPDGTMIETPAASAQDFAPEVLSQAPMYSDYRQRHVSVAGLQVGDVLEYHTLTEVKPFAPGQFWYEHVFPKRGAIQESSLEINLPKSREVKFKSSTYKYEMHETADRRIYRWTIQNFVPKQKQEDEEADDSNSQPDVQLSTFNDWRDVARWYATLQGERAAVDDGIRKKATDLTRNATTPAEKARLLYNFVALRIRYVSLSFGVGRLQPHAAFEVMQNGYGDCKDKHTLLQALLSAEGIKSYPVLINSTRKLDPEIPSPAQFDHVITAAQLDKSDNLTWLDTTPEVAPFGLILYSLRNKQALLASEGANGGLQRTPADSPVKNLVIVKIDGKLTEAGALDSNIELTAQGDTDFPLRATYRQVPQGDWNRALKLSSESWGLRGEVSDIHMAPLEDTTKPFHLTYHLHNDNFFPVPSSGVSFAILPVMAHRAVVLSKKNSSEPVDVGPAVERVYKAHFQFPSSYTIHVPSNVKITRDWGEYSSVYSLGKNMLEGERRMVLRTNELPAARRADFESFQTITNSTVEQGLWCSISRITGTAVAAAGKTTGTATELQHAGVSALKRSDYAAAVTALKQAAEQDPNQKDIWENLGQAYAGLNQHDEAAKAFQKQIEIDPDHARANYDLGSELQQQGKLPEALSAYKKQVEITPSDKLAHKALGLLLAQMKQNSDAISELETAASLPLDDPQVKMALADVYAHSGHADKAEALRKEVLGSASVATGSDIFAAALRTDVDPNQEIHDARQNLSNVGDQFDSGEYERMGKPVFSAMNLVALEWARIGWAKFLQNELLDSMQFLNSAWILSQSGTVANRLGQTLEKENQRDQARHMFALAAAAGGADAQDSREQLSRLADSPEAASRELTGATAELLKMRTVKLGASATASATARFAIVFDNSATPERVEYIEGDASLRAVGEKLKNKEYAVRFPDVSSIKIVREGQLSCNGSECAFVFLPLEPLQP